MVASVSTVSVGAMLQCRMHFYNHSCYHTNLVTLPAESREVFGPLSQILEQPAHRLDRATITFYDTTQNVIIGLCPIPSFSFLPVYPTAANTGTPSWRIFSAFPISGWDPERFTEPLHD